ncbi:hypothetical protein DTO013E5_2597 [Penicillium roqueforti]|uniref:Beta-lactamase/transpeptidase-like n=1 Tax=Penicillium roqueforti (strain FM164) TaxID=1365484 RepID=W6Q2B0_PENRF|nr:hypothetical protein CBS147372_73 [Penicillium roqueforti]CDM30445.1 Beta-lactamase/transpeptidase-like [Penicillium roqueforti FM164]KAI2728593.1 hypothetical protein CBS147354_2513 [Penicillium roqueforti]KAI2744389.1 hypothetical protein DTO012A1_2389 [Penicillium roqueforti]KAI2753061.1 hypothetical protein DTO013F2_2709 [Penicillium roqueforti]
MAELPERLDRLRSTIEDLMRIGGTPGLSLAVMSSGNTVYESSFGVRDTAAGLPVTEETIFPICSLTKALTASAMAILVDEGKLTWDTLVKDVLPSFDSSDETLQNHLTITDILSHRSGMAWAGNVVLGTENNVLIPGKDGLKYINSQPRVLPFRTGMSYNNLQYNLAGYVIEEVSGISWFEFVQSRILDPLGLDRTYLKSPPPGTQNVTQCYNALDDGSTTPIPYPKGGQDWFGGPSGGAWSCIRDLLELYKTFTASFEDQFITGKGATKDSPFKQVSHLTSAKIPMHQPSRNELSYALGWVRAQLPNRLGHIGINPGLMSNGMPTVGKGVPSQLILFHQGSLPGALAIVILLPDTDSVIVVLSNSLALNDVPDWVGQLILEELLEVPESERNDYIEAAHISVAESLKWYPALVGELGSARKNGTSPRALEEYVGTYWDNINVFKIVVNLVDNKLYWRLQGLESEKFQLEHYEDDTFTWLLPRNELSRRGRWVGWDQAAPFWKAVFECNDNGRIDKLVWEHDTGVPPMQLTKEESTKL